MGIQVALQDEHGGDLVDDGFAVARVPAGGVKDVMSFNGGEAFIPEMDRNLGSGAQKIDKGMYFRSLRAEIAGEVQRITGDHGGAFLFPYKAEEGANVLTRVGAGEREEGKRDTERVGHCNADPAVSDVEPYQAGWENGLPSFDHFRMVLRDYVEFAVGALSTESYNRRN